MDKNIIQPLVSIILPVYNAEDYVTKAIESILRQNYLNFELIIINDGSTDNTLEKIKKNNDKRIKITTNKINLGLQKTLNMGINISAGKYIARIDADDKWIKKSKLKNQIEFLESNQEYVLVGTGAICINEQGKYLYKYLKPESDISIRKTILGYNCFIHSSVVFRKDMAFFVGLYSENKKEKHAEDYDLWLKLGTVGKLHNLQSFDINHMINSQSISNKNLTDQLKKTIKIANKYKKFYTKNKLPNLLRNYVRLIVYGFLKYLLF